MRRGALIAFGAAVLAAVVALAVLAATRESRMVYSIGTAPALPVAELQPGDEACQGPLQPPADAFDRIVVSLGTYFKPGPPVEVLVRDTGSHRVLARGALAAGYPDFGQAPEHAVPVPSTTLRSRVEICVHDVGKAKVAVYGGSGLSHRTSVASIDGKPAGSDLAVRLERAKPRTLLSRLPQVMGNAALFKPAWVGAWTMWLLAALVLLAVPALVARALVGALRDEV